MKILAALVLLALPLGAQAEDMYRWRDSRGDLHYTNVANQAPPQATIVTKQLGYVDGNIAYPDPAQVRQDLQYYKKLRERRTRTAPADEEAAPGLGGPSMYAQQPGVIVGAGYQGAFYGYPPGYLSFAGYSNNPWGGYIPFPRVPPGKTPPVGAWLWVAGYELAWRELGVTF